MLFALAYSWLRLLLDLADVRLRVHNPEAELLLLWHQLRVVRRQVKRPQLSSADRTIMAALSVLGNRAALGGMLVQAETVLGWHRELVRRRWAAFGRRRGPGRAKQTQRSIHRSQAKRALPAGCLPAAWLSEVLVDETSKGLVPVGLARLQVEGEADASGEDDEVDRPEPAGETEPAADEVDVREEQV